MLTLVEVMISAGGAGFKGKIESAAELRAYAQSIRSLKPLPSWVFEVLENLETQETNHPDEGSGVYMHGILSELHPRVLQNDVLMNKQRRCIG
jgi:hypothetical protein